MRRDVYLQLIEWKQDSVPQTRNEATKGEVVNLCISYRKDDGRPVDVGYQEQTSNHLKRLLLRAMVVSIEEKSSLLGR